MRKDLYNGLKVTPALASGSKSDVADGIVIDRQGFVSLTFLVNAGAITSAGDFSFKLMECATSGGTFTDVADDDVLGEPPATMAANSAYKLGYIGSKRFVRLNVTKAGGASIQMGALALLGHPALAPVA
ncbi:hypothetical protein ASD54_11030 [Rhizobium sp. Root149]|uniref:hypothetical protein n=1 Tax=Rhizobium sp. Root149 TaxID=1736473 RepID=UPI0007154CF7|nr:hypothetical protein [Rhizobium sp. Root149]KQZ50733.1 hypothetical protein ASD54_11030 [Rhizobium sp. Root149]